jgi:hypothetical protein
MKEEQKYQNELLRWSWRGNLHSMSFAAHTIVGHLHSTQTQYQIMGVCALVELTLRKTASSLAEFGVLATGMVAKSGACWTCLDYHLLQMLNSVVQRESYRASWHWFEVYNTETSRAWITLRRRYSCRCTFFKSGRFFHSLAVRDTDRYQKTNSNQWTL